MGAGKEVQQVIQVVPQHCGRDDPVFPCPNPGATLVGLACSGGGSRAAYLTAAILKEIQMSSITLEGSGDAGEGRGLLSQLDFISSVSGGSMAAAYFALHSRELVSAANPTAWDNFLDAMAGNYGPKRIFFLSLLNPLNVLKYLFTDFNRGDVVRRVYDQDLYHGATLSQLPARPVLYINSFDVVNNVRFIFSKHYIENELYLRPQKGEQFQIGGPHPLAAENDLTRDRVDPASILVGEAVYASSAFPFVYPNLVLNCFGSGVKYKGRRLFLADGGLGDNTGLLTLLTQMKYWSVQDPAQSLALAIYIDADNSSLLHESGTSEEIYGWRGTWLQQGHGSVEASMKMHEDTIFRFLTATGVMLAHQIDNWIVGQSGADGEGLPTSDPGGAGEPEPDMIPWSWKKDVCSGKVLLQPWVLSLRLRNIGWAFNYLASLEGGMPERLKLLLGAVNDKKDLTLRLAKIETDFALQDDDRKVLDLAAYILVHGQLKPQLQAWAYAVRMADRHQPPDWCSKDAALTNLKR